MDDESLAAISSRFHIDEPGFHDADLLLLATDAVFFYAHRSVLLQKSSNCFGGRVVENNGTLEGKQATMSTEKDADHASTPKIVLVDYPSDVLDLVLPAVYRLSFQLPPSSLDTLRAVICALTQLGYDPSDIIHAGSELFTIFLEVAQVDALPVYSLVAQHSLESLAVAVSRLTLANPLDDIPDELALQMGPIYLKRLLRTPALPVCSVCADQNARILVLHTERTEDLRRLVLPPVKLHTPGVPVGVKCSEKVQNSVNQTWALAAAYVVAQSSPEDIDGVISPFLEHLDCELCCQSLRERAGEIIYGWSGMKCTI